MDALARLLHDVRSSGALFGRTILDPPWAVRFADGAPLTLVTMVRGEGWVVPDGVRPVRVAPGDVAVVVGPAPFTVTDDATVSTAPYYVMRGPDLCTGPGGEDIGPEVALGIRTCGERLDGPHALLTGSYPVSGRVPQRLLAALPGVLVVPGAGGSRPILDLTVAEILRDDPGQQAVLDRLLDLLLLATLREWYALPQSRPPRWYVASGDPVVGPALRLIHGEPARAWTVAALAREAAVSRATFARRFADLLGEPPMAYLAGWRLSVAADLLERTDATVDSIARQVGYANGYALSVALKRRYGIRPSQLRRSGTAAPAALVGSSV
jgi:AraC-like DNA-binding protein